MFSRASLTIRILGISPGSLATDSLEEKCREFGCTEEPKRWFSRGRYEADGHPLITSLARQGESDTATVTFPSNGLKQRALKKFSGAGLSTDDTFAGLTVLHSDPEPDLDICAIHGLNGNAFDTFAWGGRDMWLRDFLPKSWLQHADHKGVRVMAYGYSSLVQDDINTTGLDEWSMGLLQSVAAVRRSPSERSRPLVLVCHSLGGIVARQAMIRLEKFAPEGLQLKHCGLLFLSTPQLGTIEGNWNDFWLLFAKAAKVARGQAFTQLLSAFNQASVNAQELYSALRPIPPTECLYETQMTSVAGTKRLIVPPASAGLLKRAQPMLNVDHRTICKFPNMSNQGYLQVLDCIENVRKSVVTGQTHERQDGEGDEAVDSHTENSDTTGFIKGGNSVGGNARSDVPGGIAKGGPSTGGNINISPGYKGTKSLAGGDSKGGDAVGSVAFGGNSAGGNIVL